MKRLTSNQLNAPRAVLRPWWQQHGTVGVLLNATKPSSSNPKVSYLIRFPKQFIKKE